MPQPTVIFIPGLREHVPDHWQSLLQARIPGSLCVPRLGKGVLSCMAWVEAIDNTIAAAAGKPVVLVAHSAGVIMLAHWARTRMRPVLGAILATPPDLDRELPAGYPSKRVLEENGWMPMPLELPFRSVLVASANDPLCTFARAAEIAMHWDSFLVPAGAVGHLNPASGFGEWPQAIELLAGFGVDVVAKAA